MNNNFGNEFFLFDPNDGECLSVSTSSADCPEGLADSPYYDFYMIVSGGESPEPESPEPGPRFEENYETTLIRSGE